MAAKSFADMQPSERHRALFGVVAIVFITWVVLFGAYFAFPVGNEAVIGTTLKVIIDVVLVVGAVVWQVRRIVHAEYPELRAVQALGVILGVFLVLFSALYLSMSHSSSNTFTQPLDHMGALYFTVTVFSTVGFGDITAKTDTARAIVSIQMILDLVLIGAVARLLITAARSGLSSPDDRTPSRT